MNRKVTERDVEAIVTAIRACFARLRAVGDALHEDLGVTTAMRAVIEAVSANDSLTVPEIARLKRVSRQNIQVIVDSLVDAGLVRLAANPAHKRSSLVQLTDRGRNVFQDMRRRERSALAAIANDLDPADVAATRGTLGAMQARLETLETEYDPERTKK